MSRSEVSIDMTNRVLLLLLSSCGSTVVVVHHHRDERGPLQNTMRVSAARCAVGFGLRRLAIFGDWQYRCTVVPLVQHSSSATVLACRLMSIWGRTFGTLLVVRQLPQKRRVDRITLPPWDQSPTSSPTTASKLVRVACVPLERS